MPQRVFVTIADIDNWKLDKLTTFLNMHLDSYTFTVDNVDPEEELKPNSYIPVALAGDGIIGRAELVDSEGCIFELQLFEPMIINWVHGNELRAIEISFPDKDNNAE